MLEGVASWFVKNQITPAYKVLMKDNNYELRKYEPWVVAETVVQSTHENAGSEAFSRLGGYIFGKNEKEVKIEMTAPVSEVEVEQGKYAVQFFMPPEWNLGSLPKPIDNRVQLKKVEGKTYFTKKYNAGWS